MSPPRLQEAAVEPNYDNQSKSQSNDTSIVVAGGDQSGSNDGIAAVAPEGLQNMSSMATLPDTGKTKEDAAEEVGLDNADSSEQANAEKTVPHSERTLSTPVAQDKTMSIDPMESSTATLKPEPSPNQETNTTQTLAKDNTYLDPTPQTPHSSVPPSQIVSSTSQYGPGRPSDERSPTRSDAGFDEKPSASEDEREGESRSEIQTIMDQFSTEGGGPGVEEVMSPRLEFAAPLLGSQIQHPPRKSSLEPLNQGLGNVIQGLEDTHFTKSPSSRRQSKDSDKGPEVPPKPASMLGLSPMRSPEAHLPHIESPMSPHGASLHRPPPPEPEPEPDLPFDFHRFLEQLRHRTADPVAKFLRSFLLEFGKKQWMVHEQVKIIGDFLAFITNKMAQCEVWREVSDAEFDNAREGMEKLVMNRLYTQTFSPAIPPPQPIPGSRPRRKNGERPLGPGRRGQHQEDVERDDILAQKVSIYGWVREEHLDIPPVGESGKRFLILAQQGKIYSDISDY